MLRRILKNKIAEQVKEIVEQLGIEEILEEAVENALYEYDIEESVIENIESIAREEAFSMLHDNYDSWIEEAVEDEFNIDKY